MQKLIIFTLTAALFSLKAAYSKDPILKGQIPDNTIVEMASPGISKGLKYGETEITASFYDLSETVKAIVYAECTVSTSSATILTSTSATVGGNVTCDGAVTERGVYWGASENPVLTGTKVPLGSGTGPFSTNLSGLDPEITYFVIAYAINIDGITYGVQKTFTTKPQILLTIKDATSWTAENYNLSTVPNAGAKLYASQSSFISNIPDFTATSDVNGIVKFYVPIQQQYFLIVAKGFLSNIKDGYVITGVFNDQAAIDASQQPGAKIGGLVYKDFNGDGVINTTDIIWHDVIYVYKNQTTTKTVIIGNTEKDIPIFNLAWHKTQSTILLQIRPTVSVCINDSILLDTLYTIQSGNDYVLNWLADSLGSIVETGTNKLKITSDTTLYVSVMESNGCSYFGSVKVTALDYLVHIDPYPGAIAEISLYPNPGNGVFTLDIRNAKPGKYSLIIVDALSKQVFRKEFNVSSNLQEYFILNQIPGYYIGIIYYNNQKINHLPLIIY
jgi:hypothetical protein